MARQDVKKVKDQKLQATLKKARRKLELAQARLEEEKVRANHEVEVARKRGDRWVAKALDRVQRRASAVAELEADMFEQHPPVEEQDATPAIVTSS